MDFLKLFLMSQKSLLDNYWFDPDISLFHVHIRAYFSIKFCNTSIRLERRVSTLLCFSLLCFLPLMDR